MVAERVGVLEQSRISEMREEAVIHDNNASSYTRQKRVSSLTDNGPLLIYRNNTLRNKG
jgi:hypothetical protein